MRATVRITDTHADWHGYPVEIPARPRSQADLATAEGVFRLGQCHSLALALHRETGWPIVGADWESAWDDPDNELPGHVAVQTPHGTVLDILGERHPHEDDTFEWDTERTIPVEELEGQFDGAYYPVHEDVARPYARYLLKNNVHA